MRNDLIRAVVPRVVAHAMLETMADAFIAVATEQDCDSAGGGPL